MENAADMEKDNGSMDSADTIDKDDEDGSQHSKGDTLQEQVSKEGSTKSKSVLKQGHLRVKEDGQMVYKKTTSQAIIAAIQLGIGYSVGRLGGKPERDILMTDFCFTEKVWFPSSGSKETPSHKFEDFRFKSYAPVAFRYFRELFGILPSDFLISLSNDTIREISNPGASGSLFFVSNDDNFIVKTVQHKEATFLQQLLPGYYMNLHQNPRTLLPKFFGLYCFQSGTSNIRLVVMNNLLPSQWKCHIKFDLKGSTYKRKAGKEERSKKSPTLKDLDFLSMFPDGILLDGETYDAVIKTISRDVRWLESYKIMDYSFLLGIHRLENSTKPLESSSEQVKKELMKEDSNAIERGKNIGAALEAIQLNKDSKDENVPVGAIPARSAKGEKFYLFIGIIDILQSYRLAKKMEHGWKSLLTDGNTVSVHKPSYYARRFLDFIRDRVFTKVSVQRGPSKRRSIKQNIIIERGESSGGDDINIKPTIQITRDSNSDENSVDKPKGGKSVTIVEPNEKQNRTSSKLTRDDAVTLDDIDVSNVQPTTENETVFIESNFEDTTFNTTSHLENSNAIETETQTVTVTITTSGNDVIVDKQEEKNDNNENATIDTSQNVTVDEPSVVTEDSSL